MTLEALSDVAVRDGHVTLFNTRFRTSQRIYMRKPPWIAEHVPLNAENYASQEVLFKSHHTMKSCGLRTISISLIQSWQYISRLFAPSEKGSSFVFRYSKLWQYMKFRCPFYQNLLSTINTTRTLHALLDFGEEQPARCVIIDASWREKQPRNALSTPKVGIFIQEA